MGQGFDRFTVSTSWWRAVAASCFLGRPLETMIAQSAALKLTSYFAALGPCLVDVSFRMVG